MQLTKRLALALGGGLVVSSLVGASKGPVASLEKRAADVTPTAPGPGDVFKCKSRLTTPKAAVNRLADDVTR